VGQSPVRRWRELTRRLVGLPVLPGGRPAGCVNGLCRWPACSQMARDDREAGGRVNGLLRREACLQMARADREAGGQEQPASECVSMAFCGGKPVYGGHELNGRLVAACFRGGGNPVCRWHESTGGRVDSPACASMDCCVMRKLFSNCRWWAASARAIIGMGSSSLWPSLAL
jgi:hypothetical protein